VTRRVDASTWILLGLVVAAVAVALARDASLPLRAVAASSRLLRGVWFDLGHGAASFWFRNSKRAIDDGLHALHVRFDLPAIEREQKVAFLHSGAVAKMNSGNRCVDLRLDRNAGDGGDVAERRQTDRHGFAFSNRDLDRNGTGLGGAGGGTVRGPDATGEHNNANQGDNCPAKEPFSLDHRQFSVRTHLGPPGRSLIRGMACFSSIWYRVSALPSI